MTEEEYRRLEILVENILNILDQGNCDGGFSYKIYYLGDSLREKREQLDKIDNLIDEYLSPDLHLDWSK